MKWLKLRARPVLFGGASITLKMVAFIEGESVMVTPQMLLKKFQVLLM
jgi:hypothetical protein